MALAVVPATSPVTADSEQGSPMWWVRRLHGTILARRPGLNKVKRYYKGDFEWRYADRKLRRVFGHVFYETRFGVNWMRLIVAGTQERLAIDGIRVGKSKEPDDAAWQIWQHANLDARSAKTHHIALLYGEGYVTVWPSEDKANPSIKVDHPVWAAVEVDPDDEMSRLAGLRTYVDVYGYLHAQLFLPEAVYAFVSPSPVLSRGNSMERIDMTWVVDDTVIADGVMDNPWKVVPMVPFRNGPTSAWPGELDGRFLIESSELYGVMPIQDALNSVLMNALLVGNAQGYRQRWVTGLEIELDEDGKPKPPFQSDIDRLWQAESPDTKFGDFTSTDVSSLLNFIDQLVRQLAAASQIPAHYLEPKAERLSADSIRASESGLIQKIRHKQLYFGDAWEEVLRIAGLMTDNAALAEANAAEVMWRDPETHTLAALYDATLKSVAIGVPWRARMENLGFTPQAIDRMEAERTADAKLQLNPNIPTVATVPETAPPAPPGPWSSPVPATGNPDQTPEQQP